MNERLTDSPADIEAAARILRRGGLVAYPTDTVYGISCRIGDDAAVARLFEAKRRPIEKRVQWLVASLDQALERGYLADDRARALADAFWPGGLTIVLPGTDGTPTQGVRVPDHPVALALIARSGPLVTSSANRSGEPETYDADDVAIAFADSDLLEAIVDGGVVPGGVASSVVDLSVEPAKLLREGAIGRERLEAVIGRID